MTRIGKSIERKRASACFMHSVKEVLVDAYFTEEGEEKSSLARNVLWNKDW